MKSFAGYLRLSNLRVRLGILILLAILPMVGLTLYTYLDERNLAIFNAEGDVQQFAGSTSAFQEQLLEGTRQVLVALARYPGVRDRNAQLCSRHLAEMAAEYSRYASLGVVRSDGEPLCLASPVAPQEDFRSTAWFQQTIDSRDFVVAVSDRENPSARAALNFSFPVLDASGSVTAVAFAALDLDQLNLITSEVQMPDETEFLMIDRRGTVLAYLPDPDQWVGKTLRDPPLIEAILTKGQDIMELPGLDGVERLYAFTPVRSTVETGLYVCIGIPEAIAYREANQTLMRHLIGLGLISILALLAVWFGSEVLISRRVRALVEAAKRLSSGDMKARTGLAMGSGELDQLAHTFDEMAAALEQQALRLSQAETKYRTLVEQLPVITYIARLDRVKSALYISPQIESILGFTPSAWLADPDLWIRQIHPADRREVLDRIAENGPPPDPDRLKLEYRIFSRDGRLLCFYDEALIVHEGEGTSRYLHGVMRDITEQKEIQGQLLTYQEQLRSLASELSLVEERERRRIATALHDRVGQTLAVSKMKLGALRETNATPGVGEAITDVRNLIEEAIQETRSLIFEISSPILYELGLEAALEWLAEQTEKRHGLQCRYQDDAHAKPLDDDIRVLLFQAVGELLVNVAKHADASRVMISTHREGNRIRVVVEDDGKGFEASEIAARWGKNQGFGLFSIRERLRHVAGALTIISRPGAGAHIVLSAPLKPMQDSRLQVNSGC